jgi:hypothetical protein
MQNVNQLMQQDPLVRLIQKDNFVGWVYALDYDTARVMTNDLWKAQVQGVPLNCFLIAATFDPVAYSTVPEADREVLLMRVVGSAQLPQDDDMVRTKIDHFQQQDNIFVAPTRDFDDITRNLMQFSGLECRLLGTFYKRDGELWLGSDLESFSSAARFNVYRPRGTALDAIVNYVDPLRLQAALAQAQELGLNKPPAPFQIGTIRYTSTTRLHRDAQEPLVPVFIQPSDFLARRTAVLGMTRTGKSNMVKQMVAVVKRVADDSGTPIGQIIYDINGEYANANQQDKGALADIYSTGTIRYRMLRTEGFEELQNNFYLQLGEGFGTIRDFVQERKLGGQTDLDVFANTSFDEPDSGEISAHNRWEVRVAAYQALLYAAGFEAPNGHVVRFKANKEVLEAVRNAGGPSSNPAMGLTLSQAVAWFLAAREANGGSDNNLRSSSDNPWLDNDTRAILNLIAKKNDKGTFIKGFNNLIDAIPYHSPRRSQEVGDEIYAHLEAGKIVILDLSVGNPELRARISTQIAADIFNKSMNKFVDGKVPPNIVVYIEEAHNLIGRGMDLTATWPRLAKEGAKYRIALVYATQEVSSVHPNILANTENWFITHLNNTDEIRQLAKFYDFGDFDRSLLRAQDVGFARVKSLSSPFVIPTQIDKFNPEAERKRLAGLGQRPGQQPPLFAS